MSDQAVPAIKPSPPEEQPMIPQPLVELHGWGRASPTMAHLAQIDSVADAVSALRTSDTVWCRAVSAAAMATRLKTPAVPHSISPR
jgi:hypothetical protein